MGVSYRDPGDESDAADEQDVVGAAAASRVTPEDIEAAISGEYFTTLDKAFGDAPEPTASFATFTFCALTLRNGFIVTGEAACVSPENFDPAIGRKIARERAREKIWPLEDYLLREKLAATEAERRGADNAVKAA